MTALPRVATIAVVTALCGFTIAQGWSLVDFARTRAASGADEKRAWIGVPAFDATLNDITWQGGVTAAEQRTTFLTQLLAARPMSSAAWLALAGARMTTGRPYKDVLAALRMSAITGPNEAEVMWLRGIFCLLQWDALPPEFQQSAILDLAGPLVTGIVNDSGRRLVEGVLRAKTPQARARIALMLQVEGVDAGDLKHIGLGATGTPPANQ